MRLYCIFIHILTSNTGQRCAFKSSAGVKRTSVSSSSARRGHGGYYQLARTGCVLYVSSHLPHLRALMHKQKKMCGNMPNQAGHLQHNVIAITFSATVIFAPVMSCRHRCCWDNKWEHLLAVLPSSQQQFSSSMAISVTQLSSQYNEIIQFCSSSYEQSNTH